MSPRSWKPHEGHDVAIGRCWRMLTFRHETLRHVGPPMEKTTLDEALHACMGVIGAVPQLHGKQRRRSKDFLAAVEKQRLRI